MIYVNMLIGGLEKLTLIDYPGEIAAVVFVQGCNFRCGFCYNPMLVLPSKAGKDKKDRSLSEDGLFDFLKKRQGKLDAVVITGGEPTLHNDLPEFIAKIKDLGFKVKLDTNGTHPEMLKRLINAPLIRMGRGVKEYRKSNNPPSPFYQGGAAQGGLVDYIAMDIKSPIEKYKKITKFRGNLANINKSVKIIMSGNLPYEFRTTVVPGLVEKNDIIKMGEMIQGARVWYLQGFKPDADLVNKEFQKVKPYSGKELEEMREEAKKYVKECIIR